MTFKRQVLHLLQRCLYWTGVAHLYSQITKPQGTYILMYHSVVDNKIKPFIHDNYSVSLTEFEKQMAYLKKNCHVISLQTLVDATKEGITLPAKTVVITFDDGYLNNLELAAPVLKKYHLPATLFLCTGYISRQESQWVDQLHTLLHFRTQDMVKGEDNERYNLSKEIDFSDFFSLSSQRLLTAEVDVRNQFFDQLTLQLMPEKETPQLTMCWDDVRRLKKNYPLIELAVHTHNHADLTHLDGIQQQVEISTCINVFNQEMGYRPRYFSYPYGRHSSAIVKYLLNIGIEAAVITGPTDRITDDIDRFMLPRHEVNSTTDLKLWMTGALPELALKLFKRVS